MFCFASNRFPSTLSPPPLSNQWSRFSNRQDQSPKTPEDVFMNLSNQKAQVLLYRNNESKLSSKVKYALLAKGMSPSGKKGYATKSVSRESTQPNSNSFTRVNGSLFNATTGLPVPESDTTTIPASCQGAFDSIPFRDPTFPILNLIINGKASAVPIVPPPALPPPPPNTTAATAMRNIKLIPETKIQTNVSNKVDQVIAVGGSLKCNAASNPCTGEIMQEFVKNQCYSSSASNVPGNIILCSFPQQAMKNMSTVRKTYASGGNKFPQNAKLSGSVFS